MNHIKSLYKSVNKYKWMILILVNLSIMLFCKEVDIQVESNIIIINTNSNQGIQAELLIIEFYDNYVQENLQVLGQSNEGIILANSTKVNKTIEVYLPNKSQVEKYFIDLDQNVMGRKITFFYYTADKKLLDQNLVRQVIKYDISKQDQWKISAEQKNNSDIEGVVQYTGRNKIFKMDCVECTLYKLSFKLNYLNGVGVPSDCYYHLEEKELAIFIENKEIDYTVIKKVISDNPDSKSVKLDVTAQYNDFPNGFSQMKFIFKNYHFSSLNFLITLSDPVWKEDFENMSVFGVFLAQKSLISASLKPFYYKNSDNTISFKDRSSSFIEISFFQQSQFTCQLKSVALPQAFSEQIIKEGQQIQVISREGDKVFKMKATVIRNSGLISFSRNNQMSLNSLYSKEQRKVQISKLNSQSVVEDELKIELDCKDHGTVSRKIPIYQNKSQQYHILSILMQFDYSGNKQFSMKFQIQQIDLQGTYLVIELPRQVLISDLSGGNLIISGFTYSEIEKSENVLLFKEANISMNSIELIFKQAQLKEINNLNWKTSVTCYNSDEFLFYTTENTIQDIDIVSANGNKSQSTQFNLTSVEFRKLKPYQDMQEIRSAVPSSLVINFSLLNINPACNWIILVVPPEINIGRAQKSNSTLSDCSGQTHTFTEGQPINKDSPIGYSKENNSIFVSCTYMKSIAIKDNQNSMICINNQIQIQNVENPESTLSTNVLKVFVSNAKEPSQANLDPPLDFKPSDISNQVDSKYAYYSIENRESKGIEIKEEFQATQISLISSSDYKNDVTTHILSMSFPIYFIFGIHTLEVILPLKQLGLNPSQDISCDNDSLFQARLHLESLEYVHLIIKINDLILPEKLLTCAINNSLAILDANQESKVKVFISSQGNMIAQFSKLLNIQGSKPMNNDWIKFSDTPLEISSPFVGKRNIEYSFNFSQLNIVDQQKQQQQYQFSSSSRFIRVLFDSSLFIENTVKCLVSSLCKSSSSNGANQGQNGNMKSQIACQKISSHIVEIDTLLVGQNDCQISVLGLQNPKLNIDASNIQKKNLLFQFDYVWKRVITSSQLFSENKAVLINRIQVEFEVDFICQSSCSGCIERYQNCRNCSQDYPIWSGEGKGRTCVRSCDNYQVRVGLECKKCQVVDSNCAACSSSDIHSCTACQQGFIYEPDWKMCIDESLIKMDRFLISSPNSSSSLTSHLKKLSLNADLMNHQDKQLAIQRGGRQLQSQPNASPSLEKANLTSSESPASQKAPLPETAKTNNSSSMSSRLKDSLSDISSGNVFLVYAEIGALGVTILAALVSSAIRKKKIKEDCYSEEKAREEMSQVHRFNKRAFMLSLLTVAELFELPFSLLWAFSVSKGSWEHPVLQGMIGVTSLSVLQWMLDCYQQSCILINSDSTPPTSSLGNPLRSDSRENPLSDLIIRLTRFIFFCLNPKGICIIMTNLMKVEGWFVLPMSDGAEKNSILLTNLRKILGSQIRSNAVGISSMIIFLSLKYSELMDNYAFVYDLMLFKIVMMLLCYFNIKLVDTLLEYLEESTDSS
uniref:MTAYp n=1 Tax=Tetrahymena americanis TaxID=5891 RepID=A0A513X5C5_TETAM|nr:MTAYp [Tetrahymena americanis]